MFRRLAVFAIVAAISVSAAADSYTLVLGLRDPQKARAKGYQAYALSKECNRDFSDYGR